MPRRTRRYRRSSARSTASRPRPRLGEEQEELQDKAGDAFAASAEAQPDDEEAYLLAGQAYDQAGQPAEAIKYYNGYLDRAPNDENAKEVKDRISALLAGKKGAGSVQP